MFYPSILYGYGDLVLLNQSAIYSTHPNLRHEVWGGRRGRDARHVGALIAPRRCVHALTDLRRRVFRKQVSDKNVVGIGDIQNRS